MKHPKPVRKADFELLVAVKQKPCFICGRRPSDPCHIKSVGSGGPDEPWNLVPMCREHHTEQHKLGWPKFLSRHLSAKFQLENLGWEVLPGPVSKLYNRKMGVGD